MQKSGIVKTGKGIIFLRSLKSENHFQGVAEPAPIGVQTITRYKGDQAPRLGGAESGMKAAS